MMRRLGPDESLYFLSLPAWSSMVWSFLMRFFSLLAIDPSSGVLISFSLVLLGRH